MSTLATDMRRLCVLVVDDHEVVRWGFRLMLGGQPWVARCLGASTGTEACQLAARYHPHVAVIDLFVGGESGPDICRRLLATTPATRLLIISGAGHIGADSVRAAGGHGFIPKALSAGDIARAVRMVALGDSVFKGIEPKDGPRLSSREREVLMLVARGQTNHSIAATLHLSAHTVKGYTSSLYRKLDAKNRAQAVRRAQRLGLVS